jgi:hypothetical protein
MASISTIKLAVDLLHLPSRVKSARDEPLPSGVQDIIAIAAGDDALLIEASAAIKRPSAVVLGAANFYIEQILMAPGADSYRVLGATAEMSSAALRHNMTMLVKWLHPDVSGQHGREAFASRVTAAWDDLKTPERRADYDTTLVRRVARPAKNRPENVNSPKSTIKKRQVPKRFIRVPLQQTRSRQPGKIRRTLMYLLGLKQT